MKKSNVLIFILLAAASAFLLWLWYFLGFNRVDDPVDLVLSIVWWAIILVAIVVIIKMEQVRRQRVRTVYVGDRGVFNSEKGLMNFADEKPMTDVLASIVENLKYDFTREDFPEKDSFQVKYFVRTKAFEAADHEDTAQAEAEEPTQDQAQAPAEGAAPEQKTWKGEVVVVDTKEEKPFETPEELATILAELETAA